MGGGGDQELINLFCVHRFLLLDKINVMVFHKMQQNQLKYYKNYVFSNIFSIQI